MSLLSKVPGLQFIYVLMAVAFLAAALCMGGLVIGWLLNAIAPSIEFGTAVSVGVIAVGFSSGLILGVFLLFPISMRLLQNESDDEEEEPFPHGEFPMSIDDDEERALLIGRFIELTNRRAASDPPPPSKTKRRRRPNPKRGGK